MTSESTLELTRIDLPHASLLVHVQNPVSVIISCKTSKNSTVENTVGSTYRAEPDEERRQRQLAASAWGYLATTSRATGGVHLATLRHFDSKLGRTVK